MFRDILSGSRAIFIGIVFFVLVVGGSLLYSWHVHRTTDAELAETQRRVQPLKNKNEMHTAKDTVDTSTVDFEHVETDSETDDSQIPDNTGVSPIDETSEMLDMADAFLPDDFVSEEPPAEDVPVSPFGFGPYPEVPNGFPDSIQPIWTWSEKKKQEFAGRAKDFELMHRVLIKLWNQGDNDFVGVLRRDNDGKVYPTYPNTMYVTHWDEMETKHGLVRYPANCFGSAPGMPPIFPYVMEHGRVPDGITFIDHENQGIDPYDFLGF